MTDDLDPTPAQRALVAQLGARDRSAARAASAALASMGEAGVAAATWGLAHPQIRVRRGCAGFMDHHGTDACFAPLRQAALHDPAPSVRRAAVHSAISQECTPCPLTGDLVGLLVEVALSDAGASARLRALWGLRHLPRDPGAIAALEQILRTETDPRVRSYAHHALKHQDPGYKAAVDAQAKERGISRAGRRPHQAG